MNTVGIKELKDRLTHYLRRAKAGEEIIITERHRPVALIQKIDGVRQPKSEEALLARMAAEGTIILGEVCPLTSLKPLRLKASDGRTAASTLVEERESARY